MAKLTVTVTGLCAFTPGEPKAKGEKLRVIMPASRRRKTRSSHSSAQPPVVIPVHIPFLAATARLMPDKPTRPPDLRVKIDANKDNDRLVWFLYRDYVTFSTDDAALEMKDGTPRDPQKPGDATELQYVYWIADMRQIWPDRKKIRDDCMRTTNASADVAAHVELTGGKMATLVAGTKDSEVATLVPRKKDPVKHVLARAITVEVPFTGNFLRIDFRSLDDSSVDLGSVRLYGSTVDVMVGNVTAQDVLDLQTKGVAAGTTQEGRDDHFELYYDILEPDGGQNPELPAPIVPKQGVHQNCPPLRTE